MVKQPCSNFRLITANFWVSEYLGFLRYQMCLAMLLTYLFNLSFRIVSTIQLESSVTSVPLVTMVKQRGDPEVTARNVLAPSLRLPTSMSVFMFVTVNLLLFTAINFPALPMECLFALINFHVSLACFISFN